MDSFKEAFFRTRDGTIVLRGAKGVGGNHRAVSFNALYASHARLGNDGFPKGKQTEIQETDMFWGVVQQRNAGGNMSTEII
jgi:hypothetical protein